MTDDDPFDRLDEIERRTYGAGAPPHCFDRAGQPLTLGQWARLSEDLDYRRIASTWTRSGAHVSTVWLGLDHGFGGERAIFETMVFLPDGTDVEQVRYARESDARAGHDAQVAQFGGPQP